MDSNRKKYIGREFLKRLRQEQVRLKTAKSEMSAFAASPLELRLEVALSLIVIGGDNSERFMDRKHALQILAMTIGLSGLQGNEQVEDGLNEILDNSAIEHTRMHADDDRQGIDILSIQKSALVALLAVNRSAGSKRLNELIEQHEGSEFERDLRELRDR